MSKLELLAPSNDLQSFQSLEERHGLDFVGPDQAMLDAFVERCDKIGSLDDHDLALISTLGLAEAGRIRLNLPGRFLRTPLSPRQKKSINTSETEEVAKASVKIQDSLTNVPIDESLERFIPIESAFAAHSITASYSKLPFHEACGNWAGKQRLFWVRENFGQHLALLGLLVAKIGLSLHFEDAFRPVGVQEGLFKRRVEWTMTDHPKWSKDRVIEEARSKTAITPRLASHKAGAAVDLRLTSASSLLDIGHDYPEGGALVYLHSPFVTQEQWQNRQTLYVASKLAGLAMYVGEDWHLSYGDNLASLDENLEPRRGYVARYGPIKDFDPKTGEITEIYTPEELDKVFEI